jgi:hypothetical protein
MIERAALLRMEPDVNFTVPSLLRVRPARVLLAGPLTVNVAPGAIAVVPRSAAVMVPPVHVDAPVSRRVPGPSKLPAEKSTLARDANAEAVSVPLSAMTRPSPVMVAPPSSV